MGEDKEKIQQADNGQGNEVEKQTAESQEKEKNKKKYLLYALAWSVFVALFFMGAATAVDYEWQSYLLNAISSAGYISAAVCLTWLIYFGGIKNIGWKKRIVKAVATAIFFFGAVLLSVVTWGNVLNRDLSKVTFWLVAISWALVSIAIIVKQISLEKQDFEEKPVMSYLFILCGMIYAFAYAVILKFNFDLALKIFYTIHTVVALTVFINIIFKFGIKTNNFAQLALFIVSIITLMALLVSTLYFWFWDSYDTEIFTSIMGVFAGLLGGVLTLTGVAWTIKKQDEIRKEEEKKKMKPYIILHPTLFGEVIQLNNYDLNVDEKIETNKYKIDYFETKFNLFSVSITDNADLIWCGAIIGQSYIEFGEIKFGKRGSTFTIDLNPYFNDLRSNFEIDKVSIVYKDLSENYYKCLMYGLRRIKYLKDHVHCDMAIERVELPQEVNKIELETMLYRR